jgi:hypothetical protein
MLVNMVLLYLDLSREDSDREIGVSYATVNRRKKWTDSSFQIGHNAA